MLVQLSLAFPVEAANELTDEQKEDFEITIRELYQGTDVKKLAKKWEPKRRLSKSDEVLRASLQDDLIDLLHGIRPKYEGVELITIDDARRNAESFSVHVQRIMPTADAKKLLRFWNKKLKPFPKERDEVVRHLLKLLNDVEEASDKAA